MFFRAAAMVLNAGLSVRGMQRAVVFSIGESYWRNTLAINPTVLNAHNHLSRILAEKSNLAGAIEQFISSPAAQ